MLPRFPNFPRACRLGKLGVRAFGLFPTVGTRPDRRTCLRIDLHFWAVSIAFGRCVIKPVLTNRVAPLRRSGSNRLPDHPILFIGVCLENGEWPVLTATHGQENLHHHIEWDPVTSDHFLCELIRHRECLSVCIVNLIYYTVISQNLMAGDVDR
jgi:hypothetical protein